MIRPIANEKYIMQKPKNCGERHVTVTNISVLDTCHASLGVQEFQYFNVGWASPTSNKLHVSLW